MKKNCILLTIDSLRADHVTPEFMPNLCEYADRGVQFSLAYSNGSATPTSFPSILTGTHAIQYGGHKYLSDERPFLADSFKTKNYQTGSFHSNPHLRAEKNYDTGFDDYNDFDDEAGKISRLRYLITQNLASDSTAYKVLKRIYHLFRTTSRSADYVQASAINDQAMSWINNQRNDIPFFLWLHYMDVHYPFYPPEKFLSKISSRSISKSRAIALNSAMHEGTKKLSEDDILDLKALYQGEIRYLDHYLGELIQTLKKQSYYDETVFVVTSDHGELFGEHGLIGHPASGYEESIHVPLIIFGPGVPEGETVSRMATLMDVPPTIAGLFDLELESLWEGENLIPHLKSGSDSGSKIAIIGDESVIACQSQTLRLVWWRSMQNPGDVDNDWELWKVGTGERVPLHEHENIVKSFQEELRNFIDRTNHTESLQEPEIDEFTEDRLEALGYK